MLWFFAGLSVGTCIGTVVAAMCFGTAGRKRSAPQPAAMAHRRGSWQTRV